MRGGRALLETTFEQDPDDKEPAGRMGEEGYQVGGVSTVQTPWTAGRPLEPKHREDRHVCLVVCYLQLLDQQLVCIKALSIFIA